MSRRTTPLVKAALSALHYSGLSRAALPLTAGEGVIFMLHHVRPEAPEAFEPNRILKITPDFLDATIRHVLAAGFEPIALDDVPERLADPKKGQAPFACFTFDDGYRDNRDFALPVFERHGVPFTIYVPTAYADGEGELWWLVLERAIARLSEIRVRMSGKDRVLPAADAAEKTRAFHTVYWWLRGLEERQARAAVAELADHAGLDAGALCRELVMGWDELRQLAQHPLVTIGAHTRHHLALAKLSEDEASNEIAGSLARMEIELGRPCRHFSYPYGDAASAGEREFRLARQAGAETAVTTRKGLIKRAHADRPTALPRLSLNGDYQDIRYLDVLLSGVPFALADASRRVRRSAA